MTRALSQMWSLFSGNAEERAFCFFVFCTQVFGEDLQNTLAVQLIRRVRTPGHREQVV